MYLLAHTGACRRVHVLVEDLAVQRVGEHVEDRAVTLAGLVDETIRAL